MTNEVARFFPEVEQGLVLKAVERYQAVGTWPADHRLELPEYEGLQRILLDAGLAQRPQDYDRVVRPEFARASLT